MIGVPLSFEFEMIFFYLAVKPMKRECLLPSKANREVARLSLSIPGLYGKSGRTAHP